jgi:MFS family permease
LERLEESLSAAKAKNRGSRRWWALILLCVAQFVDVLDINAVIVALPTIGREFGFSQTYSAGARCSW